jgi:AGCS family alanine or glycine:cation symporter
MAELVTTVNGYLNDIVWGPIMLLLLVGTGIYLTVRTGCIQATRFGYIMRKTVGSLFKKGKGASEEKDKANLTPFQAVTTALAGTVGTGNIAGVTGAIFAGGPGAVFWMWVSAFFGMFTKFSEIILAMHFRQTDENGVHYGGPMYYIEKGLHMKWLACIFALLGGFACFGIGNIAQSTEIAGTMESLFGVPRIATGIVLMILAAVVILGGVKRIGQVTSYLVPFMAIFYIIAGIAVILLRITSIPAVLWNIISSAFSFKAVGGGVFGYAIMLAMRQGFARGVFSNEAGLGSAPIAHAASSTEEPVDQAMWGVFEVFVDTILICTFTALAVLLSGVLDTEGGLDAFASKGAAAAAAFNAILPGEIGGIIIQISLIFFALSTILGWSYYGERCWGYLTNNNKVFLTVFKVIFVLVCIVGATGSGTLMWDISDTLNGMMAIPNLIALLLLSGTVIKLTKAYFDKSKTLK